MTRNISDGLVSRPARGSPGRAAVCGTKQAAGLEAKPGGYEEGLWITR